MQEHLIPMVRSLPSHDDNQFGSVALDDIIIHVGAFYDNTCMEVLAHLREVFVAADVDQVRTQ